MSIQQKWRWGIPEKVAVTCINTADFIRHVIHERVIEYDPEILLKIGIDGGGNFLKVCLSIQSETQSHPETASSIKPRLFKDSGVKKLMILAIVHNVQENFRNLLTICTALKINSELESISYRNLVVCDLKLTNIVLGLMGHGSNYPCASCDTDKKCYMKKAMPEHSVHWERALGNFLILEKVQIRPKNSGFIAFTNIQMFWWDSRSRKVPTSRTAPHDRSSKYIV